MTSTRAAISCSSGIYIMEFMIDLELALHTSCRTPSEVSAGEPVVTPGESTVHGNVVRHGFAGSHRVLWQELH